MSLRTFEGRAASGGADDAVTGAAKHVGHATLERRFGTDDRKVHVFAFHRVQNHGGVERIQWEAAPERRNAGISWRPQQGGNARILRQTPGQGVFAAAGSDNQDFHGPHATLNSCPEAGPADRANPDERRCRVLAEVKIQEGESIESALRRFKRKVQQEDIIKDIKKHSFYLKPGDKRRAKQALARKRSRKKQRRDTD
jgi:small subunit ribosomal protein S21